ncbi:MAG: TlyA family RNA methyltransferase [Deltaproteobacteria bacterium]|nr:TlyA family RNA methyltransferase [Deltaproteobacteria bacterium]
MKKRKTRIDKWLLDKGLVKSREKAKELIVEKRVLVNKVILEKCSTLINPDDSIEIIEPSCGYVSRGGLKLMEALVKFELSVANLIALDVGASTGGFTDCLLQNGAAYVFSVDVGYNQLDWKLKTHPKVRSLEKTNFRYSSLKDIGSFVDLIVVDVSFISLTKILKNCYDLLVCGGCVIALIKPQFEAGKDQIQKGGVVKDAQIRQTVLNKITAFSEETGFKVVKTIPSPIQGKKKGNQEYLIYLIK